MKIRQRAAVAFVAAVAAGAQQSLNLNDDRTWLGWGYNRGFLQVPAFLIENP
jgi:hypothetical protein